MREKAIICWKCCRVKNSLGYFVKPDHAGAIYIFTYWVEFDVTWTFCPDCK